MAEDDEGGTGHGISKKFGPAPVWMWAVGLGAVGGLVWFARKKTAATPAADDTTGTGTDSSATDIIPMDQGLTANQFNDLMGQLTTLQGEVSKPVGVSGGIPPKPIEPIPVPTPPKPKPPAKKPPAKPKSTTVKLKAGQSLSSLAKEYGRSAAALWAYNITPGVRSAASEKALKARGESSGFRAGSTVYVPSTWKKK